MVNISIDLTKIDKSRIVEGKNGQKYYNITVDQRKEADKFGNTHTVYQTPTKEEREAKKDKVYIGSGKEFIFNNQQQAAPQQQPTEQREWKGGPDIDDSLPF